jgi:hypothetical protein
MLILHKIASWFLSKRLQRIRYFTDHPEEVQHQIWKHLLSQGRATAWGKEHGYRDILSYRDFQQQVPVSSYEQLFPHIQRCLQGEPHVLWPGKIEWFAKSSGTTNDKSKFIPMTQESMEDTHFKAGRDMLTVYLEGRPNSKLFSGKALSISGSHDPLSMGSSRAGDLSAVLLENLPFFYELVRTPRKKVALMSEWEAKIDAMAEQVMQEDLTSIAGVPTWTLVLINKVFEKLGIEDRNLRKVWPNLEAFFHGGVNFTPYREQFHSLLPDDQMCYMNIYNASEGFFGFQDDLSRDDMLLLLDYGSFLEFVPLENLGDPFPETHTLADVELDRTYALVISTNGGLWRYLIGDTIEFTSLRPYRIRIAGRTKHFINAFGEELMMGNAEEAIAAASEATGAIIANYTAAPIYFSGEQAGGHEWLIEFVTPPDDLDTFSNTLDQTLRTLNSDYDAKRYQDMALRFPLIRVMPEGTFYAWMKKRGKLGGQNKVPRLANERRYVEDILSMLASQQ